MKNQRSLTSVFLIILLFDGDALSSQSASSKKLPKIPCFHPNTKDTLSSQPSSTPTEKISEVPSISRRRWTHDCLLGSGFIALLGGVFADSASAACLPGDLSKECIGVYKVPIDDNILPYIGTPEKLKQYAPDLKYIPPIKAPSSAKMALELLETQQLAAEDIKQVVMSGKLEEAGIKVLNLLPVIQSSGKYLVDSIESGLLKPNSSTIDDLKISKLRDNLDMAIGMWGECDIVIGQGLRGQLGVTTVAQLQILGSLKDAMIAYDDFLVNAKLLSKEVKLV